MPEGMRHAEYQPNPEPKHDSEESRAAEISTNMAAHTEMYRLPNNPPLTTKDFERYAEGSAAITKVLLDKEAKEAEVYERVVPLALAELPKENWVTYVRAELECKQPFRQQAALELLDLLPQENRAELFTIALRSTSANVRQKAVSKFHTISTDALAPLVILALSDNDPQTRKAAAGMVDELPEKDQAVARAMIGKVIDDLIGEDKTSFQMRIAVALVKHANLEDRARITRALLETQHVPVAVFDNLKVIPEIERSELIRNGLHHEQVSVRQSAAGQILNAVDAERGDLITLALNNDDAGTQRYAADQIQYAPKEDHKKLLEAALDKHDQKITQSLYTHLGNFSKELQVRIREEKLRSIRELLNTDEVARALNAAAQLTELLPEDIGAIRNDVDAYIKRLVNVRGLITEDALRLVQFGNPPLHAEAIEACVKQTDDSDSRKAAFEILHLLPEADRARLINSYLPQADRLLKIAEQTPLYRNQPHKFFSGKFEKTGSGTTLLDIVPGDPENSLKDRVIIRHIGIDSFATWQKAYEAADVWRKAGFDYVPIEPIVKVQDKGADNVDVFARVLPGPAFGTWAEETDLYVTAIKDKKRSISETLAKLGVLHGHAHPWNFVLVFDCDAEGKPMLERVPRVYLIDFDQAISSGKNE